jgi:hypothetical protein
MLVKQFDGRSVIYIIFNDLYRNRLTVRPIFFIVFQLKIFQIVPPQASSRTIQAMRQSDEQKQGKNAKVAKFRAKLAEQLTGKG